MQEERLDPQNFFAEKLSRKEKRTIKIAFFLVFTTIAVLTGIALAERELKDIPLEWKPTEVVTAFDPIDLSPFLKTTFTIAPFTDLRKTPEEIGKNVEKRGTNRDLPVTTKDNVASWLTDRFAYVLSEFDIEPVKSNAAFKIEADIVKFYVTESSMYKGDIELKVRLRGKNGNQLWEGMVSASAERFGSSYKAENYYEALSNSVIMAVYGLLKNGEFKHAVRKNRESAPSESQQPNVSKPIEFSEVVPAEGLTKDQLYSAALAWFGEAFHSAKNVIEVQDREAGRIIGKPLFQYEPTVMMGSSMIKGVVHYSVTVEVKDGRYRYTIGNFIHEGSNIGMGPVSFGLLTTDKECPVSFRWKLTSSGTQETWEHLKSRAEKEANTLIISIISRMTRAATKTDNW